MPGRFIPHIETQRLLLQDAKTREAYLDGIEEDLTSGDPEDARRILAIFVEALHLESFASEILGITAAEVIPKFKTPGSLAPAQMQSLSLALRNQDSVRRTSLTVFAPAA